MLKHIYLAFLYMSILFSAMKFQIQDFRVSKNQNTAEKVGNWTDTFENRKVPLYGGLYIQVTID